MDRGEASLEFRHADPVKFGELDYEEGCWLPCTNWSGVGAALLMSPRQGETSRHRGMMCGVASWVSRKCLCETAARAVPLCDRIGL